MKQSNKMACWCLCLLPSIDELKYSLIKRCCYVFASLWRWSSKSKNSNSNNNNILCYIFDQDGYLAFVLEIWMRLRIQVALVICGLLPVLISRTLLSIDIISGLYTKIYMHSWTSFCNLSIANISRPKIYLL